MAVASAGPVTGAGARALTRKALERLLRDTVPVGSADPADRGAYEQALLEWLDLSEWERAVIGFGAEWLCTRDLARP